MVQRPKMLYLSMALVALLTVLGSACAGPAGTATSSTTANTPQVLRVNLAAEPATIDPNRGFLVAGTHHYHARLRGPARFQSGPHP